MSSLRYRIDRELTGGYEVWKTHDKTSLRIHADGIFLIDDIIDCLMQELANADE